MNPIITEFTSLFFTGLLAGEELVVRYGVHLALGSLDEHNQIRIRQALIRKLRVLVPAIIVPTAISGIAALSIANSPLGFGFRCAGMLNLLVIVLTTLIGTVPINKQVLNWQPDAPPLHWKALIRRWAQLDVVRSVAAIMAFACFIIAVALQMVE